MYSLDVDVLLCFPGVDRTDFLEPEKNKTNVRFKICRLWTMRITSEAHLRMSKGDRGPHLRTRCNDFLVLHQNLGKFQDLPSWPWICWTLYTRWWKADLWTRETEMHIYLLESSLWCDSRSERADLAARSESSSWSFSWDWESKRDKNRLINTPKCINLSYGPVWTSTRCNGRYTG